MKSLMIFLVFFLLINSTSLIGQNHDKDIENGLTGYYYQGYDTTSGIIHFTNLTEEFVRVDSIIDFWNGSQYYRWEPVSWPNNYSVEWKGYVFIEQAGRYGFGTMSDDGSQVFMDSILIVDNGEIQWYDWEDNISEGDTSGTPFPPLMLDSGYHEISVRFYEDAFYDGIELWWIGPDDVDSSDIPYYGTNFHGIPPVYNPNTNWEIVPNAVLFTSRDSATAIDNPEDRSCFINSMQLAQNYPNPFNPVTNISFEISHSAEVRLDIYDILGHYVATVVNERLPAGQYEYSWRSENLASGVYYYQLQAGDFRDVKKMILLK